MIFFFFFSFTLPEKWKLVSKSVQRVLTWQLISRVLVSNTPRGYGETVQSVWQVPLEKVPIWKNTGWKAWVQNPVAGNVKSLAVIDANKLRLRGERPWQLCSGPPQPALSHKAPSAFSIRHSPNLCSLPALLQAWLEGPFQICPTQATVSRAYVQKNTHITHCIILSSYSAQPGNGPLGKGSHEA